MTGFSRDYTQQPNNLTDKMLYEMGFAELKVITAILRHTVGFHRLSCGFSLSFLQGVTGLSRQAVTDGIRCAEKRGVIRKVNGVVGSKNENVYEIVYEDEGESTQEATSLASRLPERQGSLTSRLGVAYSGGQLKEMQLNKDNERNKESFSPLEETSSEEQAVEALPESALPKVERKETAEELKAWLQEQGEEYRRKHPMKLERQGTGVSIAKSVSRASEVMNDIGREFPRNYDWTRKTNRKVLEFLVSRPEGETVSRFANWWRTQDWRGKKGEIPTLTQIYEEWPRAFMAVSQPDNADEFEPDKRSTLEMDGSSYPSPDFWNNYRSSKGGAYNAAEDEQQTG